MTISLNTPTQIEIAALLVKRAEELQFDLSDYTEVGYNDHSGYVFLWSEMEQVQLGLTDYGYNRGEKEVELIYSCPASGEEFFATTPEELAADYETYVLAALQAEDIVLSDVNDLYIDGVCYRVEEAAEEFLNKLNK